MATTYTPNYNLGKQIEDKNDTFLMSVITDNADKIDAALMTKADDLDLAAHTSNTNNPHGVTKAQVGLGNVNNYGTVTDAATAQNNTVTNQYMTPQATAWAIANMITNYDSRYVRKSTNEDTSLQVISGELYAYVAGAWRVIWPPKWQ